MGTTVWSEFFWFLLCALFLLRLTQNIKSSNNLWSLQPFSFFWIFSRALLFRRWPTSYMDHKGVDGKIKVTLHRSDEENNSVRDSCNNFLFLSDAYVQELRDNCCNLQNIHTPAADRGLPTFIALGKFY